MIHRPENRTVSMDKCHLSSAPIARAPVVRASVTGIQRDPGSNPGWISMSIFRLLGRYLLGQSLLRIGQGKLFIDALAVRAASRVIIFWWNIFANACKFAKFAKLNTSGNVLQMQGVVSWYLSGESCPRTVLDLMEYNQVVLHLLWTETVSEIMAYLRSILYLVTFISWMGGTANTGNHINCTYEHTHKISLNFIMAGP